MLLLKCARASVRWLSCGTVPSRIGSSEFENRRNDLKLNVRKSLHNATEQDVVILLKGATRSYVAPDVPHQFRQCSHFRYLTGVSHVPGCAFLIYAPSNGPARKILFMDRRSEYDQLWEGPLISDSDLETTAGFDDLLPTTLIDQVVHKMASNNTVLYMEADQWKNSTVCELGARFASVRGINSFIDALRLVKSPDELASMKDACIIGGQMMSSTISSTKGCESERAIVGRLQFESSKRLSDNLAYPPVVAAGNRANTIHYLDANNTVSNGDCVLVDAGCDVNGYVSDITRCWPISGTWSSQQREVYEALQAVHEQLLQYAHEAGKIRLSSLYRRMIELLASYMLEIGLIPKGLDNQRIFQLAEELCPHHVSHYLGMDVHDCVSVSRDMDLPPGVVFTIEPGVYIPANSTKFPAHFRGMGFRIEDDIVTTLEGIEVLTDFVPRTARDIEYIMNHE